MHKRILILVTILIIALVVVSGCTDDDCPVCSKPDPVTIDTIIDVHTSNVVDLTDVIWADGKFVAVGGHSDSGVVVTSEDGYRWQQETPPQNRYLSAIAYSGERYVAIGTAAIMSSTDLGNWTTHVLRGGVVFYDVAWLDTLFIAVGSGGRLFTSVNGVNWTERESGTGDHLRAINRSGDHYVAVGQKGALTTSTDGISWTAGSVDNVPELFTLCYANGQLITGGNSLYTSPGDGENWSRVAFGDLSSIYGLTYTGSDYLVVGRANQNEINLLKSPDLTTWTGIEVVMPANGYLREIAWSDGLGRFVAVGPSGLIVTGTFE